MSHNENAIITDKHIFIALDTKLDASLQRELEYIKSYFCGVVHTDLETVTYLPGSIIYLCGDIGSNYDKVPPGHTVNIIKELSYNYDTEFDTIGLGEVPINIHNVGVYFRRLFNDGDSCHFNLIKNAHEFQTLTESTKQGRAFRTGIYLSDVEEVDDCINFNLLRCSTNLSGPTDNFRAVDREIIDKVNKVSESVFVTPVRLNHVLAQIYQNSVQDKGTRTVEKKAVIKAHSDKTKDMPRNALIAFTTFYDNITSANKPETDLFDICYKSTSVLTRLQFRLKKSGISVHPELVKEFSVTLYPNSAFIIPLSTNRLYTHEIKPSTLPVDKIPTRLGYVIRCSDTKAVFKEDQTYIVDKDSVLIKLEEITQEDIQRIRELYLTENRTTDIVNYTDIYTSMNSGDYKRPIV